MTNLLTVRLCASLLALALFGLPTRAADVVTVLQTKTDSFANVTLVSRTATHVFVQHSRGMATLKLADLDATALNSLGITTGNGAVAGLAQSGSGATVTGNSTSRFAAFTASLASSLGNFQSRLAPGANVPRLNNTAVLVLLGAMLLAYLFFCHCAGLICKKTGNEPGWLIWLPVLQLVPLLRAASMPVWWLLVMFVPVLGLVVPLIWCFKISQARGKSVLIAIMLILPVTNFFAFLYLAFADGKGAKDSGEPAPAKSYQTEPLPA